MSQEKQPSNESRDHDDGFWPWETQTVGDVTEEKKYCAKAGENASEGLRAAAGKDPKEARATLEDY